MRFRVRRRGTPRLPRAPAPGGAAANFDSPSPPH